MRSERDVRVHLTATRDGHGRVSNDEPMHAAQHEEPPERHDECRYTLADDDATDEAPRNRGGHDGDGHCEWSRKAALEYQYGSDASEEAHSAARRQIDLSRQNDEQHTDGERRRDAELDREHRDVSRAEERGREDGEHDDDDQPRDAHGRVSEQSATHPSPRAPPIESSRATLRSAAFRKRIYPRGARGCDATERGLRRLRSIRALPPRRSRATPRSTDRYRPSHRCRRRVSVRRGERAAARSRAHGRAIPSADCLRTAWPPACRDPEP